MVTHWIRRRSRWSQVLTALRSTPDSCAAPLTSSGGAIPPGGLQRRLRPTRRRGIYGRSWGRRENPVGGRQTSPERGDCSGARYRQAANGGWWFLTAHHRQVAPRRSRPEKTTQPGSVCCQVYPSCVQFGGNAKRSIAPNILVARDLNEFVGNSPTRRTADGGGVRR